MCGMDSIDLKVHYVMTDEPTVAPKYFSLSKATIIPTVYADV